tara:strand:- start:456 stop:680 length:225 start_codon:yes stop_codon:yes gene_type:complete
MAIKNLERDILSTIIGAASTGASSGAAIITAIDGKYGFAAAFTGVTLLGAFFTYKSVKEIYQELKTQNIRIRNS